MCTCFQSQKTEDLADATASADTTTSASSEGQDEEGTLRVKSGYLSVYDTCNCSPSMTVVTNVLISLPFLGTAHHR